MTSKVALAKLRKVAMQSLAEVWQLLILAIIMGTEAGTMPVPLGGRDEVDSTAPQRPVTLQGTVWGLLSCSPSSLTPQGQ